VGQVKEIKIIKQEKETDIMFHETNFDIRIKDTWVSSTGQKKIRIDGNVFWDMWQETITGVDTLGKG